MSNDLSQAAPIPIQLTADASEKAEDGESMWAPTTN